MDNFVQMRVFPIIKILSATTIKMMDGWDEYGIDYASQLWHKPA